MDKSPLNQWRKLLLNEMATIQEAILLLETTALRIVIVVDSSEKLIGTISDGDIRRGLLRGIDLKESISEVIEHNALVVPPGISRDMVIQLMTANKIQQIPIVDEDKRIVGVHLWEEITQPKNIENLMVIMAGGRGTRLHPQTENCPKPMLPIAGKPILEHIIEKAKQEGFRNFAISLFYLGDQIEKHFGNGKSLDVSIRYIHESRPLGTAGALGLLEEVNDEAILVTNGDVLADLRYADLLEFHKFYSASATMAVRSHEMQNPFGEVETQGVEIISYREKPVYRSHINAGVYAINSNMLKSIPIDTKFDMPDLFESIRISGFRTIAYPVHERWMDVGRPDELLKAHDFKSSGR